MKNLNLYCTSCNRKYPIFTSFPRCEKCNEPLEVELISDGDIIKDDIINQTVLERYSDFLPFKKAELKFSLNEGFTPLIKSEKLSKKLNIKTLYLKNETLNPTWSFKDRGTITGLLHAVKAGFNKIGTVSTGNMAVSVAAYGAKAGLKTYILVSDNIDNEKLLPIAIYGATLIKVKGDYGKLYFKSLEIGEINDIYFINSDVPFRIEGYKTAVFEICEQMNFNTPDFVIVPTSAGGNLRGIIKGFEEFLLAGLIEKMPKIVCTQAGGCSSIHNAFKNNSGKISAIKNPDTVAHAIRNPYPPSGNAVLKKLRQIKGITIAVFDPEIITAQKELAKAGFFVQPASAASLAAVKKLRADKIISQNDTVVCVMTGSGLKFTPALKLHKLNMINTRMEDLSTLFVSLNI